jgi:hypothetical protein
MIVELTADRSTGHLPLQLLMPVLDDDDASLSVLRSLLTEIFGPDANEPFAVGHDIQSSELRRASRPGGAIQLE